MEQLEEEPALHRAAVSNENKRGLEEGTCDQKECFKKARYSWQIKGKSTHVSTNLEPETSQAEHEHLEEIDCKELSKLKGSSIVKGEKDETSDCANTCVENQRAEKTEVAKDVSHEHNMDETLDIQGKSRTDTETRFEMLRDMGTEYSERIEQFLKSQANRRERDGDPARGTISHEMTNNVNTDQHVASSAGDQAAQRPDEASADSPQLHNHLLNISSWLWQKQELGCAIVDNVFNRTLEELGLSPDPEANIQATTRVNLENQSIEAAIHQQGLVVGDDIKEDVVESVSSIANREQDDEGKGSHETVSDVCERNTEHKIEEIASDIDKTERLDNILSSNNEPGLESNTKEITEDSAIKSKSLNEMCVSPSIDTKSCNRSTDQDQVEHSRLENSSSVNEPSPNIISGGLSDVSMEVHELVKSEDGPSDVINESEEGVRKADDISTEGSDTVLDLAVSTAILSQGLNIR